MQVLPWMQMKSIVWSATELLVCNMNRKDARLSTNLYFVLVFSILNFSTIPSTMGRTLRVTPSIRSKIVLIFFPWLQVPELDSGLNCQLYNKLRSKRKGLKMVAVHNMAETPDEQIKIPKDKIYKGKSIAEIFGGPII
jgi:hypothetical protein